MRSPRLLLSMLLLLAIAKTALFAEPPPENPYASPSVEIDPKRGGPFKTSIEAIGLIAC